MKSDQAWNLEKLELTDRQQALLQGIRSDEAQHLAPLREAIQKLDIAGVGATAGKAIAAGKTAAANPLAKRVARLYSAAPEHIIRRLAPPQIRTALAAVNLVRRLRRLARSMQRGMGR